MIKFNQRFFVFCECRYRKTNNTARMVFACVDNFEPEIPKHERDVIRQINELVGEKINIEFEYKNPDRVAKIGKGELAASIQALQSFSDNLPGAVRVDKTLPVKHIEYWCGAPIKTRPVQIKYLRNSKDFQVTAGTMFFMTKREYKRTGEDGVEVTKNYWTFVLDDGADRLQCVFFPTEKTVAKFEKLSNKTVVCVVGINDKKGDRTSFRVSGVSFCVFES